MDEKVNREKVIMFPLVKFTFIIGFNNGKEIIK